MSALKQPASIHCWYMVWEVSEKSNRLGISIDSVVMGHKGRQSACLFVVVARGRTDGPSQNRGKDGFLSRYCGTKPQVTQGSGEREYLRESYSCGEAYVFPQRMLESIPCTVHEQSHNQRGQVFASIRNFGPRGVPTRRREGKGARHGGIGFLGAYRGVPAWSVSKSGCFFCPHALWIDQAFAR